MITDDSVDGVSVDTKLCRQLCGTLSLRTSSSDIKHLGFCKFGCVDLFTSAVTAFCNLIFMVGLARSKEEMVRINTVTNIALVENLQSFRNLALMKLPRKAMGKHSFGLVEGQVVGHLSISIFGKVTSPKPTVWAFRCVSPEPNLPRKRLSLCHQLITAVKRTAFLPRLSGLEFAPAKGTLEVIHSILVTVFQRGVRSIRSLLTLSPYSTPNPNESSLLCPT
jgi:hypothetical protein